MFEASDIPDKWDAWAWNHILWKFSGKIYGNYFHNNKSWLLMKIFRRNNEILLSIRVKFMLSQHAIHFISILTQRKMGYYQDDFCHYLSLTHKTIIFPCETNSRYNVCKIGFSFHCISYRNNYTST